MKKVVLTGAAVLLCLISFGQTNGALTPELLGKIKQAYNINDPSTRAITNALTHNDAKKLAENNAFEGKIDHLFKYKVDVSGITDQKSSGRCWMFTSLNVLRPKVIAGLNVGEFEFSQSYLYFYDLLEKSNLFLENVIASANSSMDDRRVEWYFKSPIDDGGTWAGFINIVDKYGLVPKSVMPETNSSSNTSAMDAVLKTKLREQGLMLREMVGKKVKPAEIQAQKTAMLGDIYRILALNLGEPPVQFQWRYKAKDGSISEYQTYTPLSFYHKVLPDVKVSDYVMMMNDPTRPYYKLYEVENYRNAQDGQNWKYINLPVEDLKKIALESIKNNEAVYGGVDVGKFLNSSEGVNALENYDYEALYGMKFGMDKRQRILTWESGSSHGMSIVAVDVDKNGNPTMWQFENSWGSSSGYKGYLTFTDSWFSEYMFRMVALKKFISPEILKIADQKAVVLLPWDRMF